MLESLSQAEFLTASKETVVSVALILLVWDWAIFHESDCCHC